MFTSNWSLYECKNAFLFRCSSSRLLSQSSPLSCKFARSANKTRIHCVWKWRSNNCRSVSSHCFVQYYTGYKLHLFHRLYSLWSLCSVLFVIPIKTTPPFWVADCSDVTGWKANVTCTVFISCTWQYTACKTQSDCSWQTRSLYFF